MNLYVEEEYVRASPGGAGGVKSITNYAPVSNICKCLFVLIKIQFIRSLLLQVMKAIAKAKNRGFSDVLYLDATNKKYLEEVSSCNIFIVQVSQLCQLQVHEKKNLKKYH